MSANSVLSRCLPWKGSLAFLTNLSQATPRFSRNTYKVIASPHISSHTRLCFQPKRNTWEQQSFASYGVLAERTASRHLYTGTQILQRASLCTTAPGSADEQHEGHRLKFVRYMVIFMLFALAVKVMPGMGQHSVGHTVMLLGAPEPFWQKSGADRVKLLAKADVTAHKLLEAGAVPKLVGILGEQHDSGAVMAALGAVEELSRLDEVREAFVRAGIVDALQHLTERLDADRNEGRGAGQGTTLNDLCKQLLVMYSIQQDHVD